MKLFEPTAGLKVKNTCTNLIKTREITTTHEGDVFKAPNKIQKKKKFEPTAGLKMKNRTCTNLIKNWTREITTTH